MVFFGLGFQSFAQVSVQEPETVKALMGSYEAQNRLQEDIQGWRIQIIATTDRRLMEQTKNEFRRSFPQMSSSWTHSAPYYQVQAGAYDSKQEALPELTKVKKEFPKAYLVVDRIPYEELNKQL